MSARADWGEGAIAMTMARDDTLSRLRWQEVPMLRVGARNALGHLTAMRLALVDVAGEHGLGQERLVLFRSIGSIGPAPRHGVIRADHHRQLCTAVPFAALASQVRTRPCARSMPIWFL